MSRVVVIIPIYKATPDHFELISFIQCLKVLQRYKICIITFDSLDVSFYKNELQKSGVEYGFEYFDKSYFQDIEGYNRLLISKNLYKRFKWNEYILIYQLDAYVFRDELEYWCNKGYDYIGAPWFDGWHEANSNSAFTGVGNGGFSLRKISSALQIWRWYNFYIIRKPFTVLYEEHKTRSSSLHWIKRLGSLKYLIFQFIGKGNNTQTYINQYVDNEDIFWVQYIPTYFKKYKVAPFEDAFASSFEANATLLYKKNNNKLPFGCHAWQKYEYEVFWKKHILQ